MSLFDKVEVMDFLINVLKDHEKSLDFLISRAENVLVEREERLGLNGGSHNSPIKIVFKDWSEFKRRLENVELVCFDLVEQVFIVSVKTRQKVYEYRERVLHCTPKIASKHDTSSDSSQRRDSLKIGLELICRKEAGNDENLNKIIYDIEPQYTRRWLSDELGVHQDHIVCGDIEL